MWINSNNNARIDQIAGIRESTENVYPIENEIKINHKKNLCNVRFEWYCSALTIAVAPQTLNKRYIIILWWRQLELHSEKCKHLFAASRFFSPSTAKWMQNRAHSFRFAHKHETVLRFYYLLLLLLLHLKFFFSVVLRLLSEWYTAVHGDYVYRHLTSLRCTTTTTIFFLAPYIAQIGIYCIHIEDHEQKLTKMK